MAAGLAALAPPASGVAKPLEKHPTAVGSGGAVTSDNLQATRAGLAVLRQGGTAADAAPITAINASRSPTGFTSAFHDA